MEKGTTSNRQQTLFGHFSTEATYAELKGRNHLGLCVHEVEALQMKSVN